MCRIGRATTGIGTRQSASGQSVLCDGDHTGEPFAQGVKATLGEHVTVQIVKHNELHSLQSDAKRRIVERTFARLEKNRRLWKNCECKLCTSLQFMVLALLAMILKRS